MAANVTSIECEYDGDTPQEFVVAGPYFRGSNGSYSGGSPSSYSAHGVDFAII